MTYFEDLVEQLRHGDGNGCKTANHLMSRAADALEAVLGDSREGQAQHARWQERAETLEAAITKALAVQAILPAMGTKPRLILEEAIGGNHGHQQ